ncbi:MAG: hypothetical protein FH753_12545 [Firmicutes bacterium]|nr:hypothetical protein [Bacillota bacterium]
MSDTDRERKIKERRRKLKENVERNKNKIYRFKVEKLDRENGLKGRIHKLVDILEKRIDDFFK